MKHNNQTPDGEIRQSQILSTYGPGAMVDLPNQSVIIGGLGYWLFPRTYKKIQEERLEAAVCKILGLSKIELRQPPTSNNTYSEIKTGIRTFIFPAWFLAQIEEKWQANGKEYRTRPLVPWQHLSSGKYLDRNRKKHSVVPVRFVQACVNGHISDVNWMAFVHGQFSRGCLGPLWFDEGQTSSDFAEIFVRCESCLARRPLSDATIADFKALGACRGERTWLGDREDCLSRETGKPVANRLLVRSASNAYFPQQVSVISLPQKDQQLRESVNKVYEIISCAENIQDIGIYRRVQQVKSVLQRFSDEQIWQEVQRRKNNPSSSQQVNKTIKQSEIETLLSLSEDDDIDGDDFSIRNQDVQNLDQQLQGKLERVVLVDRLREVVAQIGFTRFEPVIADIDGELKLDIRPAPLDSNIKWLPAIENRGEGIFLSFFSEAIERWLALEAVQKRGKTLKQGFLEWLARKGYSSEKFSFPGLPYIMLHSLSHLLITSLSLECGYSASAIRERIYAGDGGGYGILLYTGSPGSEGTLGGLVQQGEKITEHLINALELGKFCSNDPVCASHRPDATYEERFLHGAACHGCLLIAETSCERRNEFLDRALVVNTIEELGAEFF
ncbi:MAG: DUF1998 domain-containing protein [Cyanobacteriota bacterium ELA615]